MTVSEAARVRAESKRELDRLRPRLEAATEVLKEHFRGSDDREYRSRHCRIGNAVTARLQLDTEKVRAELGDHLSDFQRRVTVEILSLLE